MPSFASLTSLTSKHHAPVLEIKLDNEVIVLRGNELEASSQLLTGVVVLTLPTPLKVENVHLRMTGHLKVAWNDQRTTPTGTNTIRVSQSTEIFSHRWPPFVGGASGPSSKGSITLPADTHHYPFDLILPGSMAQSVEGMSDSHIIYKLKATVTRGKLLAHDIHAWTPLRIVRTLDPATDLELTHTMIVENLWPNKVEYELSIPRKAVILGTSMDLRMRFTVLLKGLRIGTIRCTLVELQDFSLPPTAVHGTRSWHNSRDVQSWTFAVDPERHYQDRVNEQGQDGYVLEESVVLTRSLARYVQDVDVHGIRVRHRVRFNVALHNPDGHVSELRAALPIILFISPSMPRFDRNNCFVRPPTSTLQSLHATLESASTAPPCYADHVLDELYADLDTSGYMTPQLGAQSRISTPQLLRTPPPERISSAENLAAMRNGGGGGGSGSGSGVVTPHALSSRLQSLTMARNGNGNGSGSGNGSGNNNNNNNNSPSSFLRRSSGYMSDQSSTPRTPYEESSISTAEYPQGLMMMNTSSQPQPRTPRSGNSHSHSHSHHRTDSASPVAIPTTTTTTPSTSTTNESINSYIDITNLNLNKVPSYTTAVRTPVRTWSVAAGEVVPDYSVVDG